MNGTKQGAAVDKFANVIKDERLNVNLGIFFFLFFSVSNIIY